MTTTLMMRSKDSETREAAMRALRDAGFGVVEVDDWNEAPERLREDGAALVVCNAPPTPIAHDQARKLSHDLRTPLSAMAGWVHLIESGKLDEAGLKRAAGKLRGNIDDQVKMIEQFVGATKQEGRQ